MAEYHVGAGAFDIYAGILKNNGTEWKDKTKCTDEAIEAVRDYMATELLGGLENPKQTSGGWAWKLTDGREVSLVVKIAEKDEIERSADSNG